MPWTPAIYNKFTDMEKEDVTFYTVCFREIFDLLYLYTLIYEWMVDNEWHDRNKDVDFPEVGYIERTDDRDRQELWVRWRMKKDVPGAPKNFAQQYFDIDYHILALQKHEIIHEGKKVRTNKGEFEINVNVYIELNFKEWEKNPLLNAFRKLFRKRIMERKIDRWKKDLKEESHRLREAISTYLKLQQYYPEKEVGEFWRKKSAE